MKRINCVIIDDDMTAVTLLIDYIQKVKRLHLVAYFTNPIEALEKMAGMDVDLVFLDIEMKELTGRDGRCFFGPQNKSGFLYGAW